ncbi:MAG: plasmid pRiA4b ORF-3 family protein [Chloroflexales bacterium]
MPRKAATPGRIYQLKITLKGSKPPIWRRVEVPDDSTLARLHTIIQTTMGWSDSHLHLFAISGMSYGVPDLSYDDDCGGIWGYASLLATIADPEHPEYDELLEWVGDGFDPEFFAPSEANAALRVSQ